MGKTLGQADDPLLVSVRSGAAASMPGMMETVLNVGLNDESVRGLAAQSGDERFAWDSYRRLLSMFGKTVLGIDGDLSRRRWSGSRSGRRRGRPRARPPSDLAGARRDVQGASSTSRAGRDFPQDPREQLDLAVRAVFESWNTERAVLYRRQERIPGDLGTAVNVCSMVFGNLGDGLRHRRRVHARPRLRRAGGLRRLPAERAGRGRRRRHPQHGARWPTSRSIDKKSYDELLDIMRTLEEHYRDLCDIEFTIERGKLWMLQTRVGKRTAGAAFRIAGAAGRPGPDRPRRGAAPGHRGPAGAADVPAVRPRRPSASCSPRA